MRSNQTEPARANREEHWQASGTHSGQQGKPVAPTRDNRSGKGEPKALTRTLSHGDVGRNTGRFGWSI